MTEDISADVPDGAFPLVFVPEITADMGIGDRGLRKQVVSGKFPPADGNLNGRNFWFRSTYRTWQVDVLAGRYRRLSNLVRVRPSPAANGRSANPRRNARVPQTA